MSSTVITESGKGGTVKEPTRVIQPEGREPEPDIEMSVAELLKDERKELQEKYNESDPEYVHVYQRPGITGDELEAKGMDIVRRPDGKMESHLGDPLCKTERKAFDRQRLKEETISRLGLEEVVDNEEATVFRKPKVPRG